jgi:hypothetical protein
MNIDGLILEAKFPQYIYLFKGPLQKTWRDGYLIDEPKQLALEFDRFACELDIMAKNQEWSPEDKEAVGGQLEQLINNPQFTDMWVHVPAAPIPPWPTYDETHHNQIPMIAAATHLVAEAISYEKRREGGPRPGVLSKLEELLAEQPQPEQEEIPDGDLTAV